MFDGGFRKGFLLLLTQSVWHQVLVRNGGRVGFKSYRKWEEERVRSLCF